MNSNDNMNNTNNNQENVNVNMSYNDYVDFVNYKNSCRFVLSLHQT